MQDFKIEFMRIDPTIGEALVTLQDGPAPEKDAWLQDGNGTTWCVAGVRKSEVQLRPPPFVPEGALPSGARLQRMQQPRLRVAHA